MQDTPIKTFTGLKTYRPLIHPADTAFIGAKQTARLSPFSELGPEIQAAPCYRRPRVHRITAWLIETSRFPAHFHCGDDYRISIPKPAQIARTDSDQ